MKRSMAILAILLFLPAISVAPSYGDEDQTSQSSGYKILIENLKPSANEGKADSQFLLGQSYQYSEEGIRDFHEAFKWYQKATNQGHAGAQYYLGGLYLSGQGVQEDESLAAELWLKAAEGGYRHAKYHVGQAYWLGFWGFPQDYKQAAKWEGEAAELGHCDDQGDLGILYAQGLGIPQDYVMAHKWFNLAASCSKGFHHEESVKNRSRVEKKMTPAQVAEAQKLARDWKPKNKN